LNLTQSQMFKCPVEQLKVKRLKIKRKIKFRTKDIKNLCIFIEQEKRVFFKQSISVNFLHVLSKLSNFSIVVFIKFK
jgi:hypothetical protein